jgi:anthranilate synthase component I
VQTHGRIIRDIPLSRAGLRRLALRHPQRYPVLFDSTARSASSSHSILAAFPQAALWRSGDKRLHREGDAAAAPGAAAGAGFLEALQHLWHRERLPRGTATAAFAGGWVVFLGYEMADEIEPRLGLQRRFSQQDAARIDAFALRCPAALLLDDHDGRAALVIEAQTDAAAAVDIEARIRDDIAALEQPDAAIEWPSWRIEEEPAERYRERVRRAQEYIRAGDIYQANLSRPWRASCDAAIPPAVLCAPLYERLCSANPAPFAALAQFRDLILLSSSPERLLRIAGDRIETRPIAGTHPRSRDAAEDVRQAAALIAHPKERAEHVMLIDLERNDLGRICRPGTVEVDEYMAIETYAHVHHIVSNVRGRLRDDVSPIDALRAVFPGGTITGCPKFRCMQIIAELEAAPRGAYTGSLGYINRDGSADFNILIRTMTLAPGQLELRAGAGIVADSLPERELEETRAKARGLLATLVS